MYGSFEDKKKPILQPQNILHRQGINKMLQCS